MQACHLTASDLACRRGDRLLFAGLSFSLEPGQALQITGANGVGKSSLIRILAGLLRPFSGTVSRAGSIGLLDERPALDEHLPLGKALAFWTGMDGGDVLASAAPMHLEGLRDVPVRYLSTGQRKRAAMARLIGQPTDIWLLDEPLNGLDREARQIVEFTCGEFLAGGGILVIASHQEFSLGTLRQLSLAEFAA